MVNDRSMCIETVQALRGCSSDECRSVIMNTTAITLEQRAVMLNPRKALSNLIQSRDGLLAWR